MKNIDLNKVNNIFFSGIGGIGTSSIAKFMHKSKKQVSGSELVNSEIVDQLKKLGIKIVIGQKAENIKSNIDLFVYSPALPYNHVERKVARKLKIPEISYSEILGLLSREYDAIAISGTHGKSTATAITGSIFEYAKKDPNVIIGSKLKQWHGNMRMGKSNILIAEACEWKAHFLELYPNTILINNIELDHPDFFKSEKDMINIFQKFVNKLKKNNLLIINADCKQCKTIKTKSKLFTFGIKSKADLIAKNIKTKNQKQTFDLYLNNKFLINIETHLPGIINVYNILASISVAINYDIDVKSIQESISQFTGLWRRFDRVGYFDDKNKFHLIKDINKVDFKNTKLLISDYGHHPTAVKQSLQAIKEFYPNKKIILAFQPHEHTRTKVLLKQYINAFNIADFVIFEEIYTVPGRESKKEIDLINSEEVIKKIQKHNPKLNIVYAPDNSIVKSLIKANLKKNSIVIVMGAGEIYNIIKEL
jgi:UDP-N-acetylmuramate--alanine ligase